jgi:hypothetical protein
MTDDQRPPRAPAALMLGLALGLVYTLVSLGLELGHGHEMWMTKAYLANSGIGLCCDLVLAGGLFALARNLVGQEALGARLAGGALLGRLAVSVIWTGIRCWELTRSELDHRLELVSVISQWVTLALLLGFAVGLVMAAGGFRRRLALAIPLLVATFAYAAPRTLTGSLFDFLDAGLTARYLVDLGVNGLTIALALLAVHGSTEIAAPQLTARGLKQASSALWLRVIAAVGLAGLTVLLVGAGSRDGEKLLKFALITGQVVNLFALTRFAMGVLATGDSASDVPRYPFVISGMLTAWSAAVMLMQTPWIFETLYGSHASYASESAQTFSIVLPLVSAAGVVFAVIGVAGLASRRGLTYISDRAGSRGAAFVALSIATIMLQTLILPSVSSMSGLVFATLAIAVAGLVALVQMANLLSDTANSLAIEPELPKATARINDPL